MKGARGQHGRLRNPDSRAREHRPDRLLETKESHSAELARLQPISELNLMIANGYGDTPQTQLPADWRTRKREGKVLSHQEKQAAETKSAIRRVYTMRANGNEYDAISKKIKAEDARLRLLEESTRC